MNKVLSIIAVIALTVLNANADKGGNAALTSLIAALVLEGLAVDATS